MSYLIDIEKLASEYDADITEWDWFDVLDWWVYRSDKYHIWVKKWLSEYNRRWVIGHELGHIACHTVNSHHSRYAEYEADQYWLNILIPDESLEKIRKEYGDDCDFIHCLLGVSMDTMYKKTIINLQLIHIMKILISFILLISFPIIAIGKWITGDISWSVTKVTDWDTIKLVDSAYWAEYTIRILGLDTPEKSTTRFWYAECYGTEASEYVSKILQSSWSLAYAELYSQDQYKRDLADVYICTYTGELLAENIIRNWYWWVYRTWVKTKNYQKLIKAETMAKKNKVGLWNKDNCNGKRIPEKIKTWKIQSKPVVPEKTIDTSIKTTFSCSNVPRYCSWVKTRDEAQYYLNSCGTARFDMDKDWIACEDIK